MELGTCASVYWRNYTEIKIKIGIPQQIITTEKSIHVSQPNETIFQPNLVMH